MKGKDSPQLSRVHRAVAATIARRSHVAVAGLAIGLLAQPAFAIDAEVQQQLEMMRKQIETLQAKLDQQQVAQAKIEEQVHSGSPSTRGGPEVSFGGQYRINAYSGDEDYDSGDTQTASRARIRQNVDVKFTDNFKTHFQVELGHTTDNLTTTQSSTRGNDVSVRHAVLDYTFTNGINMQAGIVPLTDHFGDALFSSAWDYNPVALSFTAPMGAGTGRAFAAALRENNEADNDDDTTHYQLDYDLPLSDGNKINLGVSYLTKDDGTGDSQSAANFGIGGRFGLGGNLALNAFLIGSYTDEELIGSNDKGSGAAIKLELTGKMGSGNFGLMVTHASGDEDGEGFIPVMALSGANGYWGYTGLLTVQGPTDTGLGDSDAVNISNNGYGMTSVQAKLAFPITADLSGYIGAGWFGNTDARDRDSTVGYDIIAMGTYRFNKYLAVDFGGAFASLEDSVSQYYNGIVGGTNFNQAINEDRDKTMLFTRLQAEF